jgi:hypothetical protein
MVVSEIIVIFATMNMQVEMERQKKKEVNKELQNRKDCIAV